MENNAEVNFSIERLEIRPDTKRTAELIQLEERIEKARKDKAEALRKEKEEMEAMKRLREQEDSRYLSENEQRKQEEERKRKEEELQRQFESPINILIRSLKANAHMPYICIDSVNINSIEIRLLSQALGVASGCKCIVLHSKALSDEDGEALALGLSSNKSITHVNLDRNHLGQLTLISFSKCMQSNSYLEYISLEGNNLTLSGTKFDAFKEFMDAVSVHHSIKGLNLSSCWLLGPCADSIIDCLDKNPRITCIDLTRNNIPLAKLRDVSIQLNKNRNISMQVTNDIQQEVRHLATADEESRTFVDQVEQCRSEIELHEKRNIRAFWDRVRKYKTMYDVAEKEKLKVIQNLELNAEKSIPLTVKTKTKKK